MLDKIFFYSFAALFALTPLFWSPLNFELFEFNKMILVYFLTVVVVGSWLLKSVNQKRVVINRTPLDIPLLLFLGANILSTIFSIDRHTSIWGYYSRSNGGLLSIISYLFLYWALVSNIEKVQVFKLLKIGLISGFIISIWGILEHFGVSLSCVILRQEFNASCWVQDVQARVFATLGQPNWMASYLGMLIFPAIYFYFTAQTQKQRITYLLSLIYLYLAFTFTYSRGPTVGLIAGLSVMMLPTIKPLAKQILIVVSVFLLINVLFGSALTSFRLVSKFAAPTRPSISLPSTPSSGTQLETGGTESGAIRFIVWEGALNIFKHYPILGSGVETFAYSYYQYRPAAHNLTSEWDFLYNKAHNEYLNYLATTGIVGFGSYILVIGTFIVFCIKFLVLNTQKKILAASLLASYVSYLVSNIFGFSTVSTALFSFLFPALTFAATNSFQSLNIKIPFPKRISQIILLLTISYLLLTISKLWYADTIFSSGIHSAESGNTSQAYNSLSLAVAFRNEPYYLSELASAAAGSALALKETDATLSGILKDTAMKGTDELLKENPKNISFWRTAIRTYYDLTLLDDSLNPKLLSIFDTTISLAPTDPKLLYNKAVVLGTLDQTAKAIEALNSAIKLKSNYTDAYFALGLFHYDSGNYKEAVSNMRNVLKVAPQEGDTLEKLNEWGAKGIATKSSEIN